LEHGVLRSSSISTGWLGLRCCSRPLLPPTAAAAETGQSS